MMTTKRTVTLVPTTLYLVSMLALGTGACVTEPNPAADTFQSLQQGSTPPGLTLLEAALQSRGYTMQKGTVEFSADCDGDMCYGTNPSTVYGSFLLPPHPDVGGELTKGPRLSEGEAIIYYGRTPPKVHYFGFQTYLFLRIDPWLRPQDLFSSLGDAFNPLSIKTIQSTPFDQLVMTIATADRQTAEDVVASLGEVLATLLSYTPEQGQQLASAISNVEKLPYDALVMGQQLTADLLFPVVRVTPYLEQEDSGLAADAGEYFEAPPAVALRVTPTRTTSSGYFLRADVEAGLRVKDIEGSDPSVPYERQLLAQQGVGQPDLLLDQLQQAVIAAHGETHDATSAQLQPAVNLDGYWCIDTYTALAEKKRYWYMEQLIWCAGDTRDAAYMGSGPEGAYDLGPEDYLAVVGVNHLTSGMASYMNVAITDRTNYEGIGALMHSQVTGSAARFITGPESEYFFAVKIGRSCPPDDAYCLELPADRPLADGVTLAVRAYLNPLTQVGSDYGDLVLSRAILLKRRP